MHLMHLVRGSQDAHIHIHVRTIRIGPIIIVVLRLGIGHIDDGCRTGGQGIFEESGIMFCLSIRIMYYN